MIKNRWFTVVYMFVVTAALSSVIIGLAKATGKRVEVNATMALEEAVLQVFPGLYSDKMSSAGMHQLFVEKVTALPDRIRLPSGDEGRAWTYQPPGQPPVYAVEVAGQGFWAPIKGVIGLQSDLRTVTGISFYEQSETPGLGAVIAEDSWRDQFAGKKLADGEKAFSMRRPGEPTNESEVNAVTGATQTSVRVAKLINESVAPWREKLNR